ncbi:hypothetical protein ALC60_13690, partial [Trachymyrmex zeteki]
TPLTLLSLNCPFPLPPARTCAFSTRSFVFRFLARLAASSDVFATQKGGVGMPASLNKLNRSLRVRPVTPRFPDRLYITSLKVRSSTSPLESDVVVLCVRERCEFCLNGDRPLGICRGLVIVEGRFCARVSGRWRVVVENARHLMSVRSLRFQKRFLSREPALTNAPSRRSIDRSAPHEENMCRRHFVDPLPNARESNVGSSGITGKTVRLSGLWRLTKRHVHFSVNL